MGNRFTKGLYYVNIILANQMLQVQILLQFTCSGGDTTKEIDVEADEMNRGITTLCGFPPETKVTCSAQAGNFAGFSSSVSESVDTTSEDPVPCK